MAELLVREPWSSFQASAELAAAGVGRDAPEARSLKCGQSGPWPVCALVVVVVVVVVFAIIIIIIIIIVIVIIIIKIIIVMIMIIIISSSLGF